MSPAITLGRTSAALFAAVLGLTAQPARATVTVGFDPALTIVNVGDTFAIDIFALIPDPVVGWGLDLTVDVPVVASLDSAPLIPSPWIPVPAADGDDLAAVANPLINNGSVSGSHVLATLLFTADAAGFTLLELSTTEDDLTEGFPLDISAFADVSFQPGAIIVIPEPATGMLVAAALVGVRRRRRQARAAGGCIV